MLKLYYLPGACSLASHISLIEAGIPHSAVAVDRQTKRGADGQDYLAINPKGYVPALVLDDGEVLGETAALLPYIGALNPASRLIPAPGTLGNFRVAEWCVYLSTEVHKNLSPLFRPDTGDDQKAKLRELATTRLRFVEAALGDRPFLTGSDFTVADAYLYVILSWSPRTGIDLAGLPRLAAFHERVRQRPAVQAARKDEGLPL
jgi:glutathione S-transferase